MTAAPRQIPLVLPGHHLVRRDLRIERVEILRAADAAEHEAAGGHQIFSPRCISPLPKADDISNSRSTEEHIEAMRLTLHGGSDHRKIQPILAADIAVKDMADMQAAHRRSSSAAPRWRGGR